MVDQSSGVCRTVVRHCVQTEAKQNGTCRKSVSPSVGDPSVHGVVGHAATYPKMACSSSTGIDDSTPGTVGDVGEGVVGLAGTLMLTGRKNRVGRRGVDPPAKCSNESNRRSTDPMSSSKVTVGLCVPQSFHFKYPLSRPWLLHVRI